MEQPRHWREKTVEEMTEQDWSIFNEEYNISYKYKGSKITPPMRTWSESRLSVELLRAVEKAGYKTPSPILMAAIPHGLQQRDVIGIAQTGSGKTAAFILPMLNYISKFPIEAAAAEKGPYALILAPPNQLAEQIEEETLKFAQYLGFKVVSINGTGQFVEEKGIELRQGCQIVIATPRRLIDCLERGYVALNNCKYVVLYDPDLIVHMGFESHVTRIFDAMPSREEEDEEFDEEKKIYTHRTTYLFGAIMTSTVERLASKYLRNPVVVTVGKATTDFICRQHVIMMSPHDKFNNLQRLLGELNDDTAIVFVNFHPHVFLLADDLVRDGYRVTTLHLYLSEDEMEIRLEGFRTHTFNVLVATTEVFGCEIDIPDAAHVVNYDMPKNIETYIHHLGRASVATTFLTLWDKNVFYDLKLLLYKSNSHVPPELANYTVLTTRCRHPLTSCW